MLRDDCLGSLKTKVRIATTVGLIAVAGLASPAFGQSFVGEWTATATTPGGDVSESLKVVRTAGGYQITAKAVVPPAPGTPPRSRAPRSRAAPAGARRGRPGGRHRPA